MSMNSVVMNSVVMGEQNSVIKDMEAVKVSEAEKEVEAANAEVEKARAEVDKVDKKVEYLREILRRIRKNSN